ncbi:helix-turn-helix transcriptional regulator [Candidatus Uabimicrobium sp. HlEnr_7]|uniref:helix-turn-helix transcriptional regulator n=1 Tax=Candidatus Uabimicrobium helgolandensis TaxID=3095367 RepID=UPI003557D324
MSYVSFERLKYIDSQIRQNLYPDRSKIAEIFGVHTRTIQRDLDYMRDRLRAPIDFDRIKKGFYYTKTNYILPALYVNDKDIFSLSVVDKILTQYKNSPYFKETKEILDKVLHHLPEEAFQQQDIVSFKERPFVKVGKKKVKIFEDATAKKRQVDMVYQSFHKDGEITSRVIDPYNLITRNDNWYVIAFCNKRQEMRTFALARVKKYKITCQNFKKNENFCLDKYIKESFDFERGVKVYNVKLHFSAYQANWIRERKWHRTQKILEQDDGSLILSMKVRGLNELKRWVLYHGPEVKVLEPLELQTLVIENIKKMSELYK